jgi:hypothetical protein
MTTHFDLCADFESTLPDIAPQFDRELPPQLSSMSSSQAKDNIHEVIVLCSLKPNSMDLMNQPCVHFCE